MWLTGRGDSATRRRYAIAVGLTAVLALLFGGLSSHPHVIDTTAETVRVDTRPHCPPLTHHQEHCRAEQPAPTTPAPSPVDDRLLPPVVTDRSAVASTDPGTRSTATGIDGRLFNCVWRI
ncbi:hypothetical protein ACFQ3B_23845 [Stackebrandtia endophytica]|uniref:hypothetical protein n=1 Tax=Stackebrandtia endophytica TaxID=1496996 RepID=UPI0011510C6E|nr:hypothetical protein [Stackebrandtia endophytica]